MAHGRKTVAPAALREEFSAVLFACGADLKPSADNMRTLLSKAKAAKPEGKNTFTLHGLRITADPGTQPSAILSLLSVLSCLTNFSASERTLVAFAPWPCETEGTHAPPCLQAPPPPFPPGRARCKWPPCCNRCVCVLYVGPRFFCCPSLVSAVSPPPGPAACRLAHHARSPLSGRSSSLCPCPHQAPAKPPCLPALWQSR